MNRIETIVSLITSNDKVADIGCDQAEVGIMLAKKGIKSIASDVSGKVIEKAKSKIISLNLSDYVKLRVGNGLDTLKDNEADTLVLAGMGTYTIFNILNTDKRFNKIITISNNNHDELRYKMNKLNYKVDYEIIIKEKGIYYNLIVFNKGNREYSEEELLFGFNHKNKSMHNEWKKYLLDKYSVIQKNSKGKNEKINKIINLLTYK